MKEKRKVDLVTKVGAQRILAQKTCGSGRTTYYKGGKPCVVE